MGFEEILYLAKQGDEKATEIILELYSPIINKYSVVNGQFDEDLRQELVVETIRVIRNFQQIE